MIKRTVAAAGMAIVLICLSVPAATADAASDVEGDANALQPRKIASNVRNWRILPDSRILLLRKDKHLAARYVADNPDKSNQIVLGGSTELMLPLSAVQQHAVTVLSACTVGLNRQGGGFDVVNVKTGQRQTVLETSRPVSGLPLDANAALLIEQPVQQDANQHILRVHRLDLTTRKTRLVWTRNGVGSFENATPSPTDANAVRLWFTLPIKRPKPPEASIRSTMLRPQPIVQATLDLKTGKAREVTLSRKEAQENGLPSPSRYTRGRSAQARRGRFHSPDGKATVAIKGKRLTLTRRGSGADLFEGQYSATVFPSSMEDRPRRLAIVKTTGEKRELIMMDLKTLDKTTLATLTELDSVKGWSPSGRFLVAEQYSPTNLDDHGHLVVYEPARWRKASIFPQNDQKYITLLGFAPGGWAVLAGDTMIEDAIGKTRLSVADLTNPDRRCTVAQGRLFRVAAAGDSLIFSDFDGETFTLYRTAMPEPKQAHKGNSTAD